MPSVPPLPPSRIWPVSDGPRKRRKTRRVVGLPKGKAEELLDWLEAHGWHGHLLCADQRGFTVEYERPVENAP